MHFSFYSHSLRRPSLHDVASLGSTAQPGSLRSTASRKPPILVPLQLFFPELGVFNLLRLRNEISKSVLDYKSPVPAKKNAVGRQISSALDICVDS